MAGTHYRLSADAAPNALATMAAAAAPPTIAQRERHPPRDQNRDRRLGLSTATVAPQLWQKALASASSVPQVGQFMAGVLPKNLSCNHEGCTADVGGIAVNVLRTAGVIKVYHVAADPVVGGVVEDKICL